MAEVENFDSVSSDYKQVLLSISEISTVVQEQREIPLTTKKSSHRFNNVPYYGVDAGNINIISKKDFSTSVVSQVLHKPVFHDTIRFLDGYKGKKVSVSIDSSLVSGTLKEVSSRDILIECEGENKRYAWEDPKLVFLRIDDDSIVPEQILEQKNQLASVDVSITAETLGEQILTLMYFSKLISWQAEYQMRLNTQSHVLELSGNYVISNQSAKTYSDAEIRLLLSQRTIRSKFVGQQGHESTLSSFSKKMFYGDSEDRPGGVSYSPYHVYNIKNYPSIPAFSTTKIPITVSHIHFDSYFWIDANFEFHCDESLIIDEHRSSKKTTSNLYEVISFKNSSKVNLPPGDVDLYFIKDYNSKKKLEELREPPIGEDVNVFNNLIHNICSATFDGCYLDQVAIIPLRSSAAVKCYKERKSFKLEEKQRKITESFVISVTNEMKTSDIVVQDSFHRSKQWILSKTTPEQFEIIDASSVLWTLPAIKTGSTFEVKYTVTYTWPADEANEHTMQLVEDAVFDQSGSLDDASHTSTSPPRATSLGFFSKLIQSKKK